ncbi:MAG: hypothetical protein VX228_16945, partial [Pseudomonadota bacterium]|nr:hypothetical protein [Pseudomonadota bacterium]
GNFVDLCVRGFYNNLPFVVERLNAPADGRVLSMSKADAGEGALSAVVAGRFSDGFVDPITARPRCVPLEVLRPAGGLGGGGARRPRARAPAPAPAVSASDRPTGRVTARVSLDVPRGAKVGDRVQFHTAAGWFYLTVPEGSVAGKTIMSITMPVPASFAPNQELEASQIR